MTETMEAEHRQHLNQPAQPSAARPLQHSTTRQQTRPRRRLRTVIVIALLALGGWWAKNHLPAPKQPEAAQRGPFAVPVLAAKAAQKDVPIYLDGLGTVQAYNTVTIHSRVDGQLDKVAFTEGQEVHTGDLLAQIDPRPFKAAFDQAVAKKGQDEAQLANARLDLKRNLDLVAAKVVTQQAYDTQKALVDQLEATVRADQAAINSAKVQLDYTTISSPLDGKVGIRLVDQGNIVHANDPNGLVVITQLHPISVIFTLPEQNLGEIRKQMTQGDLAVLAVDRDNKTSLGTGILAVIDNEIDTTTGTLKLRANFPNRDLRLWPGQFVNARLLLTTRKNGIVVPAAVIQRGPEGSYAFVIKPGETADAGDTVEVRPVKVAQIEDGQALLDEGLRVGERVVVEGQYRLQAGSKVKVRAKGKPAEGESE